jgi:hypothetical protein
MRSEVLTAVKMLIFWVVTLCGFVDIYQRFGGTYRLHLQHLSTKYGHSTFLRNLGISTKSTRRYNPEDHHRYHFPSLCSTESIDNASESELIHQVANMHFRFFVITIIILTVTTN